MQAAGWVRIDSPPPDLGVKFANWILSLTGVKKLQMFHKLGLFSKSKDMKSAICLFSLASLTCIWLRVTRSQQSHQAHRSSELLANFRCGRKCKRNWNEPVPRRHRFTNLAKAFKGINLLVFKKAGTWEG